MLFSRMPVLPRHDPPLPPTQEGEWIGVATLIEAMAPGATSVWQLAGPPATPGPGPMPKPDDPSPPPPPSGPDVVPPEIDDPTPPEGPTPVREPPAMPTPMAGPAS
jgi:hypothetical protein